MSFRFLTRARLVSATTFAADAPGRCANPGIVAIDLLGPELNAAGA